MTDKNEIKQDDIYYTATLMENRFIKGAILGAALGGCVLLLGAIAFGRFKR